MKNKRKFSLGDKVKVLEGCGYTLEKGDIGIITEFDPDDFCRVTVEGKRNYSNITHEDHIELVKAFRLSNKEKSRLLEDLNVFEVLSFGKLLKLIWWDIFNHRKINLFFNYLNDGRSVNSSFIEASK